MLSEAVVAGERWGMIAPAAVHPLCQAGDVMRAVRQEDSDDPGDTLVDLQLTWTS